MWWHVRRSVLETQHSNFYLRSQLSMESFLALLQQLHCLILGSSRNMKWFGYAPPTIAPWVLLIWYTWTRAVASTPHENEILMLLFPALDRILVKWDAIADFIASKSKLIKGGDLLFAATFWIWRRQGPFKLAETSSKVFTLVADKPR